MTNPLKHLRILGLMEGFSYLALLCIAMPLKYFAEMPVAVKITGMIHGILFILYLLAGYRALRAHKWPYYRMLQLFIAAVLPFGPFVMDHWLKMEENSLNTLEN